MDFSAFYPVFRFFFFRFYSILPIFQASVVSFLSLNILIRRWMLPLRLPGVSAACRFSVISDTFLILWIVRKITAFYTKACLKTKHRHPLFQVLFGIQQKNGVFL